MRGSSGASGANEEYQLVPRRELEYLHREVEEIKRNPFGETKSSKDLLSSMAALNKNIERLVHILETANDEIVRDYKDGANTERLNRILEQNEKLAKGIVAIAELLKELKELRLRESRGERPATAAPPSAQDGGIPFAETTTGSSLASQSSARPPRSIAPSDVPPPPPSGS